MKAMKGHWCLLIGLALFLRCCIPEASAQRIRIHGIVTDRDGDPVPFANVKLSGKAIGGATDLKGRYSFTLLPIEDSTAILFSAIGYRTVTKPFPGGIKDSLRLDVSLPDEAIALEGVTVTATGRKKSMEQIKPEHVLIAAAPVAGVEALVATYAGVTQNNELSSQYSVRGGSYDENMIYVNGMEIARPLLVRSAQQEGLSFVNPRMTERVDFSAGGFTAEYGDKMSSVLDIRYKKPAQFEAAVDLGLQGDNLYIGSHKGGFSQITGVRFKDGRNMLSSLETKGEYRPLYLDAQTYMVQRLSSKWQLSLLANVSLTDYTFIPQTRETVFGTTTNLKKLRIYFDGREQDNFLSAYGAFTADYTQNESVRHSLSVALFGSRERETYDIEGSYFLQGDAKTGQDALPGDVSLGALATGSNLEHGRNKLDSRLLTASYRLTFVWNRLNTLRTGADVRIEQVKDDISEWTLLDSAGYNRPHYEGRLEMLYNLYSAQRMYSVRASLFAQNEMQLGQWRLVPGLRASWWSFNKEFIISPRLVASYRPKAVPDLLLRTAAGLYYQAPFYKELRTIVPDEAGNNYVALNRKIKSQGSVHLVAGADYAFRQAGRPFKFTAEVYFKYLFHINPYRVDNVKIRYMGANVGSGYAAGIDLKLFGEFVPGVDSWVTASLLHSRQTLPGIGSMRLPNAPLYNCSLFFRDYFPGFKPISLSLRGLLSGGLPQFKPAAGFELPVFTGKPYMRVDIGLTYRFFERTRNRRASAWDVFKYIEASVDLFNLFDNANAGGYYWVTDANNHIFAVPNYLTRRQLNIRLSAAF